MEDSELDTTNQKNVYMKKFLVPTKKKFLIPTKFNVYDSIVIDGKSTEDILSIILSGDGYFAFELNVSFSKNKMKILIPALPSHNKEYNTNQYFTGRDYVITLDLFYDAIRVKVSKYVLHDIALREGWLDDFKCLSINGIVKNVAFKFEV